MLGPKYSITLSCIICIHRYYDLFMRGTFSGHFNVQLGFVITTNKFLDLFDLSILKVWESIFDFESFSSDI